MDAGDQLNQDMESLQTHIVKSNLETLHQKLNDAQITLHKQHLQFLRLANRMNPLDNFVNRTVQILPKWIEFKYQFDQSLEHSINLYNSCEYHRNNYARSLTPTVFLYTSNLNIYLKQ
ncbi:hypothetical protein TSAR_008434 [Trichomalopsis sarcophagae]|uniref:Uncharacterized protein n=1 Tax=Trichomalopsis sarcophagae TaxID=543379 RepID=A0A232EEU1_9HYME|nr:hypothetical protein TSAR_008434 [Trichomalopsis sarcophagae]